MQFYNTFGYQWLEGSIRRDLDRGGRGDWADILSLASISRRAGYLERSPGIPYTIEEMAQKFFAPLPDFKHTIDVCLEEGRLSYDGDGRTLYVTNWNKYQKIPLGTITPTKPIQKKSHPLTEEQKDAINLQRQVLKPQLTVKGATLQGNAVLDSSTGELLQDKTILSKQSHLQSPE